MSWHPRFVEAFTHTFGNEARVADLGLSVAAVLCAHAMNVGFAPVTTPGAEALNRDRLHHVDQNHVRFETMAAANVPLVEAQAEIELAQAWGGGLVASVDGLRFMDRALAELRAQGYPALVEDVPRLSPFVRRHISIDGHHSFHLPDPGGGHRPLRDPDAEDDAQGLPLADRDRPLH